ncbi:MAG: UDP-galactose phosphate transferase [Acidobacteria bacterium]|nr:MAG: UDP-galactose phosphate transferase [Acidobacteriota bacterium]
MVGVTHSTPSETLVRGEIVCEALCGRESPESVPGLNLGRNSSQIPIWKRSLDLVIASLCLILALPLMLVVAVCVRVTMGSPILFRQQRPGLGGRPFVLYKFRTMFPAGDSGTMVDEHRISRLGAFLRCTSFDELPELWNVLRGDMSLVGPRPLLMCYIHRYSPEQSRRHEVLPGITGWAQVNGRNAIGWEERFALDLWYVDHQSLWLDFNILCLTLLRVLRGEGINRPGYATMPEAASLSALGRCNK